MMKKFLGILILLVAMSAIYAQGVADEVPDNDLESQLEALSGDAAKEYVAPITSPFGANMNSGWFQQAPRSKKLGLNVSLKFVFMGTNLNDDEKSFNTTGKFQFTRNQAEDIVEGSGYSPTHPLYNEIVDEVMAHEYTVGIEGPTITGSAEDNINVFFGGDTLTVINPATQQEEEYYVEEENIELPVHGILEDMSMLPQFAPQLSLGTVMGTMVVIRWLPNVNINDDLGEFSYWGVGIQHNPIVWMSDFVDFVIPVDVSLSFFMQQMEVGEVMKTNAYAGGLNVSKTIGMPMLSITPYAGMLVEKSNVEFSYQYKIEDSPAGSTMQKVSFDVDGKNEYRFLVGAAAQLSVIQLSFDYNFSEYNSFSASLGVGVKF